ncbi:MAG: histidine kinase dimerization/phospho-acceptor domain-containing protein, partial [Pseudomonadales bacterium]
MEGLTFNLRRQLILVSILLLSLPWAGCQFIREMEGALRQGQEQGLQATAEAVASVVGAEREIIYPDPARIKAPADTRPAIYALPFEQYIPVDGYGEGWEDIPSTQLRNPDLSMPLALSYQAVTRDSSVYLLIQVEDPEVIYHNPGLSREPNGDRLILRTWQDGKRQEYVVATAAPGSLRARAANRQRRGNDPGRIQGYWQDAVGGYTLELEIPLSYTGERLGFYIVNKSSKASSPFETLGNISPLETTAPPWLIYTPDALQASLAPFAHATREIQVSDNQRWRVAQLKPIASGSSNSNTFWLLRWLYRSILSEQDLPNAPVGADLGKFDETSVASALSGKPSILRYRAADSTTRTLIAAASPIYQGDRVIGSVIVSQSGEQYLSLTDQAFSRLLGYSALAIGIGALGLLTYATVLSLRIRKLSEAASNIIDADGAIAGAFPRSQAQDEIGELSRRYADLLEKLREYNEYLRTLSRKLSHELRTPIAVIQSSLENLEQGTPEEADAYIERARGGLVRLNRILSAMSEASRLEESIRNNQICAFDLAPLLSELKTAYASVYSETP